MAHETNTFKQQIKKLSNQELVATYQYVSGIFARFQEKMTEDSRITSDLVDLKHEILNRLEEGK